MRHFKILIENVVGINVQGLDYSTSLVEIKQQGERLLKIKPLNQISQNSIIIEACNSIDLVVSLLQSNILGSRAPRPFAQGFLSVQSKEFQKQQKITFGCSIKNIISKKAILTILFTIREDLQKMTYALPDSQISCISEAKNETDLSIQIQQSLHEEQPILSQIQVKKEEPDVVKPSFKKQPSINKRSPKRPIRVRHCQYMLKSQSPNTQIKNNITDQQNIFIENVRLLLDQAITSIQFYGKKDNEQFAQVFFKTNPTQEELKQLRIKVPEDESSIRILLNTLQGQKLQGLADLPQLDQNQSLKIECDFKDKENKTQAKMKFNYKQLSSELGNKPQKMQLSELAKQNNFGRNKIKQQLQCISFLNLPNKQKQKVQISRIKLPRIVKKQQIPSERESSRNIRDSQKSRLISNMQEGSGKKLTKYYSYNINENISSSKQKSARLLTPVPVSNEIGNWNNTNLKDQQEQSEPCQIIPQYNYDQIQQNQVRNKDSHSVNAKRYRDKNNQLFLFKKNHNKSNLVVFDEKQGHSQHESEYDRKQGRKTVHQKPHYQFYSQSTLATQKSRHIIKILSISVKIYENQNLPQQYEKLGKFLQIFSTFNKIYRTQAVFTPKILNWKLQKCQLLMNQMDNLTFQLNVEKENTLIGHLIISYNQLKFNEQQNSLYFDYLTKNSSIMGKINLQYKLYYGNSNKISMVSQVNNFANINKNRDEKKKSNGYHAFGNEKQTYGQNYYKDRLSSLEKTSKKPNPRIYTQLMNQYQEDDYRKNNYSVRESPAKKRLYESTIPTIPEVRGKRNRICQQHKQHQLVKENKRKRFYSIDKNQRYY